ncbi:MAG: sigma-70 family RNA polymerase sigma factor [Bacteroidales bacterium]|jgi:RNA polymerase sigma-70 factor (ECF subfamily)|nr:sigma-70 family RNA polymerase sigma factor [Bacteroidales bacterium]
MTSEVFKKMIVTYQPDMQRMAESVLHDPYLSEDAVQEAMIQLWQQRNRLDSERNLRALCVTMAKRRSIDLLRKQRPFQLIDEEALEIPEPTPNNIEERYQKAMKIIERLPSIQQKALLMKYEEEKNTEEITRELNISSTNLYTILSRAYAALREMMKNEK